MLCSLTEDQGSAAWFDTLNNAAHWHISYHVHVNNAVWLVLFNAICFHSFSEALSATCQPHANPLQSWPEQSRALCPRGLGVPRLGDRAPHWPLCCQAVLGRAEPDPAVHTQGTRESQRMHTLVRGHLPARHRWRGNLEQSQAGSTILERTELQKGWESGGREAQASLSLSQKRINCMQNNGIFCSFSTKRIFYVPPSYATSNFAFYVNTHPQQQEPSQANLNKYRDFGLPRDIIFEQESLPIVALPQ